MKESPSTEFKKFLKENVIADFIVKWSCVKQLYYIFLYPSKVITDKKFQLINYFLFASILLGSSIAISIHFTEKMHKQNSDKLSEVYSNIDKENKSKKLNLPEKKLNEIKADFSNTVRELNEDLTNYYKYYYIPVSSFILFLLFWFFFKSSFLQALQFYSYINIGIGFVVFLLVVMLTNLLNVNFDIYLKILLEVINIFVFRHIMKTAVRCKVYSNKALTKKRMVGYYFIYFIVGNLVFFFGRLIFEFHYYRKLIDVFKPFL